MEKPVEKPMEKPVEKPMEKPMVGGGNFWGPLFSFFSTKSFLGAAFLLKSFLGAALSGVNFQLSPKAFPFAAFAVSRHSTLW